MNPWTLYWQADRVSSCLPTAPGHQRQIDAFWVEFGRMLPPRARLIDLATGNGAVPLALRRAGLDLDITAVDLADIDPLHYLSDPSLLDGVHFLGNVDLAVEDVSCESFDAATSQFGIEYLPLEHRAGAVARRLDPGGRFCLLLHHEASEVVTPRRRDLGELGRLLQPGGLAAALTAYSRAETGSRELSAAGRRYLQIRELKTERLSGQILEAVRRLMGAPPRTGREVAADLVRRMMAEHERLSQLVAGALDADGAAALAAHLEQAGLEVATCSPLEIRDDEQPALIGWHVSGRRK